jgi:hypothetical protein
LLQTEKKKSVANREKAEAEAGAGAGCNATQRKTTKKTTIAIYSKYRSTRIAKQKNLTEHRGRNNQERKSP